MRISFNRLDRGYLKYKHEYDHAALKTLESGWYILGKNVEKFESEFSQFTNTKYCVGLNSGLDALKLAFRALNVGEGDEVIIPANTYIASVIGITENGALPIFVEPDEYYNIDADKIEEKISSNTKAILAVHLYGQGAKMKRISDIAKKHNLYLIEDCAQSHGAESDGMKTGSWGDIGCFSFYPTKVIGAFGDAGAIVCNDSKIKESIKKLRNYGSEKKYQNELIGVNSRLDELQAAFLSVKLAHYHDIVNQRRKIADDYLQGIQNENIRLPKIREGSDHVWHLFVIEAQNRGQLQDYLFEYGIETQIHYPVPPHLSRAYKYLGYKQGDFPITEKLADRIISLPLYEGMSEEETAYVIKVINKFKG